MPVSEDGSGVFRAVQDMDPSPTLQLAKDLMARPSVSPQDAGCLDVIGVRLARLGFSLERMDRGRVSNLWARRGERPPLVCFAGHTDVVPPGLRQAWDSDPFEPVVRDGYLYGRGAADMKSSIAAFVTAIERYVGEKPQHPGSIALLLTSDEEGDAVDGTVRVVETLRRRDERPDFCIVGEPTSVDRLGDTLKNGRRGSLSGRLTVSGVQGHVAYPQLARNPIHGALLALHELAALTWDEGNEFFPPTTWQISNIHAGTGAGNVIPGQLEVAFNFRFAPTSSADALRRKVHSVLDRHKLDYSLEWTLSAEPYLTPPGRLVDALGAAVRAQTGISPGLSTTGGTSDGRFIATLCPEVVELGPLNATIHKLNECVAVSDVDLLSRIYEHTLNSLLVD
jgi:succinyl-diaminopimelate desuccinylase